MARAHAISESGRWSTDSHPVEIEYPLSVAEQIRAESVEGFCRFPRGGVEVGGILFGNAEGHLVRVLARRPAPCEYAFGPSYVLSEKDEAALRRILEVARTEPELTGMVPVGWYHSHTRSEVFLSPQDLAIQDRYFPGRRQIALVVKPEPFGTARAGFFVREADGSIRTEASYREFVIPVPGRQRQRPSAEPAFAAAPEAAPEVRAAPAAITPEPLLEPEPAPPPSEPLLVRREPAREHESVQPPRPNWMWLAIAALTAICFGVLVTHLQRPNAPRHAPLGLRVMDANGRLRIAWDRNAIRGGRNERASLDITERTGNVHVPFDAQLLRDGSVAYARRTGSVEVRLRVERPGGTQEEFVQFLGSPAPPPEPPAPEAAKPAAEPDQPPPQPVPESAKPVAAKPVQPSRQAVPEAKATDVPRPAAAKPEPKQFNLARLQSIRTPRKEPALPAPPAVEAAGAHSAVQTAGPPLPTSTIRSEPPPPAPAPATAPVVAVKPKPAYTGPSAGRIIWTGDLARGASVWIDGRQVSAGTATGELPGVPVRISVHPADLSGRGLTIFTASGRAVREPAGPQNGWNPTAYTVDPRRAGELLVLESPSPQNGWKKLSFRNDTRGVSVIVIDWKVAE
jgi:proteasome lid subunit RPN8/RPN11